jgi:ribA/ribD-fused uncharacterized protein
MTTIDLFRDKNGFLSNMWSCIIEWNGIEFGSSEALYQARKFDNQKRIEQFATLDGKTAKKYANSLRNEWKKDWNKIKRSIMYEVLYLKFTQNAHLKAALLETGDAILIEGNWWGDTYWGVCNGEGENVLGKLLMQIRELLRSFEI